MKVEQVALDHAKYGPQTAGGSTGDAEQLGSAPAASAPPARQMLIAAAAQTWSVRARRVHDVGWPRVHAASKRSLGYGELADKAATMPVPGLEDR